MELRITSHDGNLEPYKLLNRTENLSWNPPFVEFDIERHGATVNGSVYAEVHHWRVNVETTEASIESNSRRQVGQKDKALKVQPLAQEIASLILGRECDIRLIWKNDKLVRLDINKLIPATNQQTTASRRKRFKTALEAVLAPHGWKRTSTNTFEKVL